MKINIPNNISYEALDHDPNVFPAFSPDYEADDIGKSFDLTITLFGHQLGSEEVQKLVKELNQHLIIDQVHQTLNGKIMTPIYEIKG